MPSTDKQLALSVEKTARRELPNRGAKVANMSQGTSALSKDKVPTTDPGKAVGTKRLQSDNPSSPGYHNVYVRRKVESEHGKVNSSQELKGNGRDKTKEQEPQQDAQHHEANAQHHEANKPQVSSPVAGSVEPNVEIMPEKTPQKPNVEIVPAKTPEKTNVEIEPEKSPEKPDAEIVPEKTPEKPNAAGIVPEKTPEKPNAEIMLEKTPEKPNAEIMPEESPEKPKVEIVPEKTVPPVASGTGIEDDIDQSSQYWNERFNRLQAYLENCDRSTQEGYLRKLRSLSAAGRSMHAIELEKRAIHLLVEEGKELQRMKALNVLGKVSPSASSKQTPLQRQSQK